MVETGVSEGRDIMILKDFTVGDRYIPTKHTSPGFFDLAFFLRLHYYCKDFPEKSVLLGVSPPPHG
jgi:hypothetical protein